MTREHEIYKVTLLGSAGNFVLLTFKFVAGIMGHSSAMIADAVHSLSDFVTDILIIVFVRISNRPKDDFHTYGHGKYETLATLFVSLMLTAVAAGIILSGSKNLWQWWNGACLEEPGAIALWAALLSITLKELLYQYTIRKGRRLNSQVMIANAWHHRSDAFSSVGVAVGIGGAILLGNRWTVLDPLASIIVGLMLVKAVWNLLRTSVNELTECALPAGTKQEMIDIINSFPDVQQPHNIHTRCIGYRMAIEVHICMDGRLSLFEVHERATSIEKKLKERFGSSTHVSIHMEPVK